MRKISQELAREVAEAFREPAPKFTVGQTVIACGDVWGKTPLTVGAVLPGGRYVLIEEDDKNPTAIVLGEDEVQTEPVIERDFPLLSQLIEECTNTETIYFYNYVVYWKSENDEECPVEKVFRVHQHPDGFLTISLDGRACSVAETREEEWAEYPFPPELEEWFLKVEESQKRLLARVQSATYYLRTQPTELSILSAQWDFTRSLPHSLCGTPYVRCGRKHFRWAYARGKRPSAVMFEVPEWDIQVPEAGAHYHREGEIRRTDIIYRYGKTVIYVFDAPGGVEVNAFEISEKRVTATEYVKRYRGKRSSYTLPGITVRKRITHDICNFPAHHGGEHWNPSRD